MLTSHYRLTPSSNFRKDTISSHITTATVSSAADIVDTHELKGEPTIQGCHTTSQAVWQFEGGQLRLFVSAKSSSAVPLIHLAEHLLDFCEIQDPLHIWLLHILLTEPNDTEVEMAFAKQNIHVEVPEKSQGRHFL